MKALSLWEPWASLMAVGAKANETRGRPTNYRGELVICAALRRVPPCDPAATIMFDNRFKFGSMWLGATVSHVFNALPFGCAVCVVDVVGCRPSSAVPGWLPKLSMQELALGDHGPGRWVWITTNLRRLKRPVPVVGRQGLFNLKPDEEKEVRRQLG